MDLNGQYKLSIELTARRQVLGLIKTVQLIAAGTAELPAEFAEEVAEEEAVLRQHQVVYDSVTMTIDDHEIRLSTGQGTMHYKIQGQRMIQENTVTLDLDAEEVGSLSWDVWRQGDALLIDSIDGVAEYAFLKVS